MKILKWIVLSIFVLLCVFFSLLFSVELIGLSRFVKAKAFIFGDVKFEAQNGLKLIGCGFPRTLSMKGALEMLGYKVYHMEDCHLYNHNSLWSKVYEDPENNLDDMISMILSMGYNATIDVPTTNFCFELKDRFPEAKVLLTVRDSAEKWFQSYVKLFKFHTFDFVDIFPLYLSGKDFTNLFRSVSKDFGHDVSDSYYLKSIFPWVNGRIIDTEKTRMDEEATKKTYLERNQKVLEKYGEDEESFLQFNVKEGWGPLLNFLGMPSSVIGEDEPFPHFNAWEMKFLWYMRNILVRIYPFLILSDLILLVFFVKLLKDLFCTDKKKKEKEF